MPVKKREKKEKNHLEANDEIGIYYAFFARNWNEYRTEQLSWEVAATSLSEAWKKILSDKRHGRILKVSKNRNYIIRVYLSHTVKSIVTFPDF